MLSIGWVVLAERPGREMVLGSVTQPWQAAPVFRSVPCAEFRDFSEPGYVKIVWTLRADSVDETAPRSTPRHAPARLTPARGGDSAITGRS